MDGSIGSQLRSLRTTRKLTQKGLAQLSGISQQHLSRLEQGRGGVELSTLQRLLDALGHRLLFVPRPATAADLTARRRQWERFAAWESASGKRAPVPESLAQAGALADFFLSRHKTRPTQPELRAQAERVRAWRRLLARVRPEAR